MGKLFTQTWYDRVEALIAIALAGRSKSFDPTPFLNQTAWFISYHTGKNTNDGKTAQTPVASASEIRRRWNGGVPGVRPTLPAINVTVTVMDGVVASSLADPLCVLWDLDMAIGGSLVVDCATTVERSGTINAVPNAFARTSTGQQTITDAGVATWAADVDHLLIDTTSGAAAWVIGGTATATISASRAQSTNAAGYALSVIDDGLAAAAVSTHPYEILTLPQVYFGTQSRFGLAGAGTGGATQGIANVLVRRGHGLAASGTDFLHVDCTAAFLNDNACGASVVFAECQFDQNRRTDGGTIFANCSSPGSGGLSGENFSGALGNAAALLCGYARNRNMLLSSGCNVDQDFQLYGTGLFSASLALAPGEVELGNLGRFLMGGAANLAAVLTGPAEFEHVPIYDAQSIFYGTTSGHPIYDLGTAGSRGGGAVSSSESAATTFVFDGGAAATFQIDGQANAYGMNTGTGVLVGPTALTVAHLDAALGAGTGLGGRAIWPPTGSRISVTG